VPINDEQNGKLKTNISRHISQIKAFVEEKL